MKTKYLYILMVCFFAMANLACAQSSKKGGAKTDTNTYVLISTNYGDMKVLLYNETPLHKQNFIKLVSEGYYNDLLFHRVIKDFMIQGGDPDSRNAEAGAALGNGGPDYLIPAEMVPGKYHKKGALAAARTGGPENPEKKSSGSQFYIVQGIKVDDNIIQQMESRMGVKLTPEQAELYKRVGGSPWLDNQYTVFGEVVEGLDVIDKIAAEAVDSRSRPLKDVKMKITILKKGK